MSDKTLVYGIGINDLGEPVNSRGKNKQLYDAWRGMLRRCYSFKSQIKRPSYIGCTVCDEWKYLSNFKRWFDENYVEGFHLDKDILVEGNKIYSPETCRYVPVYLNSLLTNISDIKLCLPVGVSICISNRQITPTYRVQLNDGRGKVLSKNFKTVEDASQWYSITKKRIVKEQAIRAFLDNAIKTDVYLALVRRNF